MSLELLTISDLSKMLKLSRNKIYQLIREGKIKSLKLDNSRRFTTEHVDEYLKRAINETEKLRGEE